MSNTKKPWESRWEKGEGLGQGGTGTVFRARRLGSNGAFEQAIKLLSKNKDPERRARFRREADALQKIVHPLVPKLADSNAETEDGDEALYIVMDYVDGSTLECVVLGCQDRHIEGRRLALGEAVELTGALVDVVGACAALGMTHRDIKPDNIVLRGDNHRAPTLIDFGQCATGEDSQVTGLQDVGARFLRLPEHVVPGEDRRDPRSDLTLCCGVLFFCLSGLNPALLRDSQERPPHKRPEAQAFLTELHDDVRIRLTHLFDVGFQYNIDQRWQDVGALRKELASLFSGESPDETPTVDEDASGFGNVWTIKLTNGQLDSLYMEHWLQEDHRLRRYWRDADRRQFLPIGQFDESIQRAASVLWCEVLALPAIATGIKRGRREYMDHMNHSLLSSPLTLKWGGQQTGPNGMEQVPGIDLVIGELSAAALSAIAVVDAELMRRARAFAEILRVRKKEWDAGD
jgi:serine/threonine protein kinase